LAELRRRRRDLGWRELILWVPEKELPEAKRMIEERYGKPPSPVRPRRSPRGKANDIRWER